MGHVDTDVVIYTVIFVPFHLGFAFTGATLTLSTPGPLPAACQKQPVGCSHSQFAQLFGSRLRSHSCSYLCSHSAPSMQAMQPATPAEVAYLNGCDAPPTPTEPVSLKVIDYVIDLFFVSDILLNLRTTYLRPDGKYETSIRAIRRHYLKGWFLIDCTASIALIVDICRDLGLISGGVVSSLISFLKACRLLRVAYLLKNFDHFASAGLVRVVIRTHRPSP